MFGRLLNKNGIKNQIEIIHVDDHYESAIWIYDEDQLEKAEFLFDQFQHEEHDLLAEENLIEEEPSLKSKTSSYPITSFFIGLCTFLFVFSLFTTPEIPVISKNPIITIPLETPPIKRALLYDWPKVFEKAEQMIEEFGTDAMLYPEKLPAAGQKQYQQLMEEPVWYGIYPYLLGSDHPFDPDTLFYSIRKGEVWRIFTPCLLHYDLIHIFFNLMWLIFLGQMLEKTLTKTQYLTLIFIGAIVTNTSQYLMIGPNFLGFSGVITTFLGFIWMRQKIAPWEAYPLPKSIITFMAVFIFGMLALSLIAFFSEFLFNTAFPIRIANTAHIAGAIIGAILAKFPYFSSKQRAKMI